jgi:hypothetical protein
MTSPDCAVTILRARGRRLAKLIQPDGRIIGYDNAKLCDADEVVVHGFDHLVQLQRWLLPRPDRCAIRGSLLRGPSVSGIRRLLHPDPQTGDEPTLYEVPRRWAALDVDGLERPPDVPPADVAGCARIARNALPPEFHDRQCLAVATASHGIKPGIRLRLWFWLDGAATRRVLQHWLIDTPGVDLCTCGPSRSSTPPVPYLPPAPPIPCQTALWCSPETRWCPSARCPPPPLLQEPASPQGSGRSGPVPSSGSRSDAYRDAALVGIKAELLRAGEGHRHFALIAAACRLLELGSLSDGWVGRFIRDAAHVLNGRGTRQIDPEEVDDALEWARARSAGRAAA